MDNNFTLDLSDEAATLQFGALLAKVIRPNLTLYLHGDLGAGKTTLIKKICAQLGYSGEVCSPTYGLVNPYLIDNQEHTIYHSDWYRIKDLDELYDAGIEDNLYAPNSTWLIEWPQVGMEILMGFHVVDIEINHLENSRSYLITDYPLYTF